MIDRNKVKIFSLSERENYQLNFNELNTSHINLQMSDENRKNIEELANKIRIAKRDNKPIIYSFGAHLIKNGLSPVLVKLMKEGFVTHFATNGAGSIHDLEFALVSKSGENVSDNVKSGTFGTWEETGAIINGAILRYGIEDCGYGEAVGKAIKDSGDISFFSEEYLEGKLNAALKNKRFKEASALSDLLAKYDILKKSGLNFKYLNKENSLQYWSAKENIPLTIHPGIGYDIIYLHPFCTPSAIGRACEIDFLRFVKSVKELDGGGVYLSIGSAIMSPMIFEKSLSFANNLRIYDEGKEKISDFEIAVVDLQDGGNWDWQSGEPPKDNPAYYLRFCKTFSRMGGNLRYLQLDNRKFLYALLKELMN